MTIGIRAMAADMAAGLDAERELVERAKRDREAFAQLYRSHCQPIARYIYRRVGDAHLTEDLTADVFTVALRMLPRFRHRGVPVRAWLYRIAGNRVNRWARRERRHALQRLQADPAGGREYPPAEDRRPVADAGTDRRESREYVRTALLTLAPKHQTVLALHYLEGMPVAEVAVAIGVRVGTVKSRLARGREALRRRLEPRRTQP